MKGNPRDLGFSTRAVHAGQTPDPRTGSVTVPIYQTSTYVQSRLGEPAEYEYARVQNPTRSALEEQVAQLERRRGELEAKLADPDLWSDPAVATAAVDELSQVQREIEAATARWEELAATS